MLQCFENEQMEGTEFQKYIDHFPYLKKFFVGTFAIDTLPKALKNHCFLIFNSDKSDQKGQHWLCLYKEKKTVFCFDSIGIDDHKKNLLLKYCNFKGITEINFNETQFQLSTSETCGRFVIYFLIHRNYNKDLLFTELLEDIFDRNCFENEIKVKHFFEKVFKDL